MSNEELLELIRKDRPNQVIHEVTGFREHPLHWAGVQYEVDVIMETQFYETKIRKHHMKGLPYPVKPYNELQKKWEEQTLQQSINQIDWDMVEEGVKKRMLNNWGKNKDE
jgi:hypothetical protein